MARSPASDADTPKTKPRKPLGLLFHFVLLAPLGGVLWCYSSPVSTSVAWIASIVALAVAAILWLRNAVRFIAGVRGNKTAGSARRLLLAPLLGLATFGLVSIGAPLEARWRLSEADFMGALDEADTRLIATSTPDRLGLYDLEDRLVLGDATVFQTDTGLTTRGGFAHLPGGPAVVRDHLPGFSFRSLGADWYAWVADD